MNYAEIFTPAEFIDPLNLKIRRQNMEILQYLIIKIVSKLFVIIIGIVSLTIALLNKEKYILKHGEKDGLIAYQKSVKNRIWIIIIGLFLLLLDLFKP